MRVLSGLIFKAGSALVPSPQAVHFCAPFALRGDNSRVRKVILVRAMADEAKAAEQAAASGWVLYRILTRGHIATRGPRKKQCWQSLCQTLRKRAEAGTRRWVSQALQKSVNSTHQLSQMTLSVHCACRAPQRADGGEPTIFDKIIAKEIPASVIYEDDTALAFKDINPQAPVHFLVIPKHRDGLTQLSRAEERHEKVLGHLLYIAGKVAEQGEKDKQRAGSDRGNLAKEDAAVLISAFAEGLSDGFRVAINDGVNGCELPFSQSYAR